MLLQMYKSISIRDARQSLELNTSLWRLSWVTFLFLPATFLSSFFGMNVAELEANPSMKWYVVSCLRLVAVLMSMRQVFCRCCALGKDRSNPTFSKRDG